VSSGGELDVFGVSSVVLATGSIRLSRSRLNFGKVAQTSTKQETFKMEDVGKGDLHVTVGTLQPPFQVQGGGSITVTKGQPATVTVVFAPTGSGRLSQTLTVSSDDPKHPSRSVTVSGTGK
jgi:Abnormal spindle-like microcephaly-assoc'd, ASPM-SPD-2-Hydin